MVGITPGMVDAGSSYGRATATATAGLGQGKSRLARSTEAPLVLRPPGSVAHLSQTTPACVAVHTLPPAHAPPSEAERSEGL